VLKLIGAAYLIFLGVQAIRHRRSLTDALATAPPSTRTRRVLADGFMVGIANPKTAVFFLAVLPQFLDRGAGGATPQLLLLGAIFYAIALVCDSLWAIAAGSARLWFARSPSRLAAVGGAGGVAMIGIGASLALTGRKS
jgi:threonine/homoserine/homoserine lactone efflux protein